MAGSVFLERLILIRRKYKQRRQLLHSRERRQKYAFLADTHVSDSEDAALLPDPEDTAQVVVPGAHVEESGAASHVEELGRAAHVQETGAVKVECDKAANVSVSGAQVEDIDGVPQVEDIDGVPQVDMPGDDAVETKAVTPVDPGNAAQVNVAGPGVAEIGAAYQVNMPGADGEENEAVTQVGMPGTQVEENGVAPQVDISGANTQVESGIGVQVDVLPGTQVEEIGAASQVDIPGADAEKAEAVTLSTAQVDVPGAQVEEIGASHQVDMPGAEIGAHVEQTRAVQKEIGAPGHVEQNRSVLTIQFLEGSAFPLAGTSMEFISDDFVSS